VEEWAAGIPATTYAIDDQTSIKVKDETVEVVSEGILGRWRESTCRGASGRNLFPRAALKATAAQT
jgi:hypothetical protein